MKETHTTLLDQYGRTIIGKKIDETDTTLTLNNPVIMHIEQQQDGGFGMKLLPILFMELLDKEDRGRNNWTYQKSNVVVGDVAIDADFVSRYTAINTPPADNSASSPKIVKIDA